MKCHLNHEHEASGICRACFRSLCENCTTKGDWGYACPGKCEAAAKALVRLTQRSIAVVDAEVPSWVNGAWLAFFLILFGSVMSWGGYRDSGYSAYSKLSLMGGLISGAGATFLYGSVCLFLKRRRLNKMKAIEQSTVRN